MNNDEQFDNEQMEITDEYSEDYSQSQPINIPRYNTKSNNNDNNHIKTTNHTNQAGKGMQNIGSGMENVGKGMQKTGQGVQKTGQGVEKAGQGVQKVGKGVQNIGKTSNTAGDVMLKAGGTASATGVGAVAGVPIMAIGGGAKALGTATNVAGKGAELSGKGIETSGKGIQASGKGIENSGKKIETAGSKTKQAGEKLEKASSGVNTSKDLSKSIKSVDKAKKSVKLVQEKGILITIIAFFFAIILIFYQIMSPVMESYDKYNSYKQGNFGFNQIASSIYSGLNYNTTKEDFYEELEYQFNQSNGEIDLALLMSALFYTETMNDYSTDYELINESDSSFNNTLNEITSSSEYSDSDKYTQGQIIRARLLAKGMTDEAKGERLSLSEFIEYYGTIISENKGKLQEDLVDALLSPDIFESIKNSYNLISGPTYDTSLQKFKSHMSDLIENVTLGSKSLGSLEVEIKPEDDSLIQIYVTLRTKKYSEDKFKEYLSSYYIKKMPEFQSFLKGLKGNELDGKIEYIINEIYEHRTWYSQIYGDIEGSSEEYEYTCIGGISPDLVSELGLPVKVTASSLTFTGEYPFGIVNSKMHNGIDLNSETTGTKEGDDVFAIANGTITDIVSNVSCNTANDSSCDEKGSWIKLKHSLMVDGTIFEFYSVYMNLQANSTTLKKGDKVQKGAVIGKVGKTGDTSIAQVHFEFHNENDTPIDPTNLFIPCTSGGLVGSDNAEKIWFYFRNLGYSEISTAAAIGNFSVESGLDPTTVQGDYLQPDPDKYNQDYTNRVDNGTVSKNDFIYHGPGGGGYGLIQWTYNTRKKALYEYMQKERTSIGDLQMQLEYLTIEINDNSYWMSNSYKNQWKNASDLSELNSSTTAFMKGFENPGVPHLDKRKTLANEIYNKYKGKKAPSSSTVQSSNNKIIASAKEIKEYIASNGYTYGGLGVEVRNAKNSRTVDCSSYVSWVLYNAGYDQFGGYQQVAATFNKNNWGFKEVSKSDVKPGDILVFGDVHVEIYAGMEGETTKVYNAGSNGAIKNPGVTNSSRGLNATTKILRP